MDHLGLNKYHNSNDQNFLLVKAEICRMAQGATHTIKERYCCMTPNFHTQDFFSCYSNNSQANEMAKKQDFISHSFQSQGDTSDG